jgi:hypothetical protein
MSHSLDQLEGEDAEDPGDFKWSKNGFGEGVNKQQTGKFTKEESELVRKAVEDFCAMKQVSVARLCSECDHKAELKGAWMEIARRLPHRSVQSVYRHGLRQLHPFKRGAWTEEERDMLVDSVQRMGKKWASIQTKLNRSSDSCRDKYRELGDDYVKGRWKESESELLKKLVREHLSAEPTADIKELGKVVLEEGIKIPWQIISKRMGKRSRLSCFKKWQKMTGLYSPSEQYKTPPLPPHTEAAATEDSSSRNNRYVTRTTAANTAATTAANTAATATATATTRPTPPSPVRAPPSTHSSASAGAAAALAATSLVNNPVTPNETPSSTDFDHYLLSELASLDVTRSSDVNWEGFRLDNAQERWNELLEEWQSNNAMDDTLISLPLSDIAQLMMERKTSAQRAAETVEAVDLPPPESLHTREA